MSYLNMYVPFHVNCFLDNFFHFDFRAMYMTYKIFLYNYHIPMDFHSSAINYTNKNMYMMYIHVVVYFCQGVFLLYLFVFNQF